VAAFNAYLEIYCSCTGVLFEPVELELHYDPARVAALGAREADLRLALYDLETGDWVERGRQRAVPERDVVTGSHTAHARQFYTILVRPGSGDGSSWGRIKSLWLDAAEPRRAPAQNLNVWSSRTRSEARGAARHRAPSSENPTGPDNPLVERCLWTC
jgi:hypothetical protein